MQHDFTRKEFILSSLVIGGVAASSLVSTPLRAHAGETEPVGPFTLTFEAGTYRSSAKGQHGPVEVEVEFTDHGIKGLRVTENPDTPLISHYAVDLVVQDILRYQTYDVDTCTGATMTSHAILSAVQDCFDQANAQVEEVYAKPEPTEVSLEDAQCDILVIGAGTAGIMAAAAAATVDGQAGTNSGLSVIVVEQLPFAGGSFPVSGAGVATMYGDPMHESGEYETIDEDTYVAYLKQRSENDYLACLNEPLQRLQYQSIRPAEVLMMDLGAPFTDEFTSAVWPFEGEGMPKNGWLELGFKDGLGGNVPFWATSVADTVGAGYAAIIDGLDNVDLRLCTRVDSLVVADGGIAGATVTQTDQARNRTASYTIHAKKVILATGAPNLNYDFLETQGFDLLDAAPFSGAGSTGVAFSLIEDAGFTPVVIGNGGMCYNGLGPEYGMEDGVAFALAGYPAFNADGKRYFDEGATMDVDTGRYTCAQPNNTGYFIVDSTENALTTTYEDYVLDNDYGVKADTIEEVAELAGLDPDVITEGIALFNRAAAGKVEDELGCDPSTMRPVVTPPFYAVKVHAYRTEPYITLKTLSGSTQIVDEAGEGIPNLYGAGTCIGANIFYHRYFSYDGGLTTAMSLGYLAASEAKAAINQ